MWVHVSLTCSFAPWLLYSAEMLAGAVATYLAQTNERDYTPSLAKQSCLARYRQIVLHRLTSATALAMMSVQSLREQFMHIYIPFT